MFNKNDPLISSVTKVMQENQARRDAITVINEAFGITDKRHLPFQAHAEYDALVEEMTQEALVGGQANLDVNRNDRLDKQDFKMLRDMKKKPMEEASLDEVLDTDEKKMKYAKKASDQIKAYSERGGAYDTSEKGKKDAKGVEKRTRGLQSLIKKIQKKAVQEERGKKVARAILEKMRAKAGMEEEVVQERVGPNPGVVRADQMRRAGNVTTAQQTAREPKAPPPATTTATNPRAQAVQAYLGRKTTAQQTAREPKAPPTMINPRGATPVGPRPEPKAIPGGTAAGTAARLGDTPGAARAQAGRNPMSSMAAGRAAERNVVSSPKTTTPPATAPKPAAPARTIQGPGDTTATMTGRGPEAIVKTGGQTYKGSVVKNRFGGKNIQNFGSSNTPMGPKGKVNE